MSQKGSDAKAKTGRGRPAKVEGAQKRNKSIHTSYGIYINRLLKNSHPEMGVTKNGMKVLNSFVLDIADRLATEAATLSKYHKQKTVSSFHLIGAVKLVLPPEIAQNAIEEGQRAYKAYSAAQKIKA